MATAEQRALTVVNLLVPGAGLVVAGHVGLGVALLLPTILTVAVAGVVAAVASRPVAMPVLVGCAAVWVLLAVLAGGAAWWWARRARHDPQQVRALQRQAVGAWLRDEAQALPAARALAAAAPEEPGAWRVLALVARDAGDARLSQRAERRALTIEDRV